MIKNNAAAMINRIQLKQAKRSKVKDTTKRYLSSLKSPKSPFVTKVHTQMLSLVHKIISLEKLDIILSGYPSEPLLSQSKLKGIGNEIVLNKAVMALSLFFNGALTSTIIVIEGEIKQFKIKK
jgi:UDP-N-acetylglucosamine:LPS N-acetylglucosamine transferase